MWQTQNLKGLLENRDRKFNHCSAGSSFENKSDQNKNCQITKQNSMYKAEDESVMHIISGCSKLAQREYRMSQVNTRKAIFYYLGIEIRAHSAMKMKEMGKYLVSLFYCFNFF